MINGTLHVAHQLMVVYAQGVTNPLGNGMKTTVEFLDAVKASLGGNCMNALEYRLIQDLHKKPLVMIESALGNGQEIYPDTLRSLAAALIKIAAESEARDMGKGYCPARETIRF
jgi:hypothetical protein